LTPRRSPGRRSDRRCSPRRWRSPDWSGVPPALTAPVTVRSAAATSFASCVPACEAATRAPTNARANWAGGTWPRSRRPMSRRCRRSFPSRRELEAGRGLGERPDVGEQLLQLAALVHLERDIAATDQFAIHVQLRVG